MSAGCATTEVIFALRHPAFLLGLLPGFLIGVIARSAVQQALARSGPALGRGPRRGRLRPVGGRRSGGFPRPRAGWAAYLDPYGAVAALLSGAGWGARAQSRRSGRGSDVMMLVAALVVHAVLVAVGLAGYRAAGGDISLVHFIPVSQVLHGSFDLGNVGASAGLGFAMVNLACGLLALVPIPPLELGVILWSRLPRSPGARRLAYRVLEEQWGVAVILLLLLLPLAGQQPVLLSLIDNVSDPILRAL